MLQILFADNAVAVVVDERECLAELLDLGGLEEREYSRGLSPLS